MSNESTSSSKTTLSKWKKAAIHPGVTLPSGTEVTLKIPDLPALIESGQIPNQLVDLAVDVAAGKPTTGSNKDLVKNQIEFTQLIVTNTVVDPKVEATDVGELPVEDREMIVNIATRVTDIDAVGNQLGGLHTQKSFRAIRGLPDDFTGLEGLQGS